VALKLVRQADVVVIRLIGDIDMEDVVAIKNAMTGLIHEECSQLVLDLGSVQHINAVGFGILAETVRRLRAHQGDLRLSNVSLGIRHVLDLMGMSRFFKIYETRDAAVHSFKALSLAA
jgi:anti-anti-sigma factor